MTNDETGVPAVLFVIRHSSFVIRHFMFRLFFYPIADSYLLVAVAAVVLVMLLAVLGPSRSKLNRRQRLTLAILRGVVIVLVVLAMLRPTLVYTETKKQSATVLILADRSRSMSVPASLGGKTRWETLARTLQDAQPALGKLARDFEVKAFTFDNQAHPAGGGDGKIELPEEPDGQQPAIGAVLEDVIRQEAGKRLLGVILLSDGAQRAYAPRDLPPQTAAAKLRHLGYPLFTFPFGQSRGLGQAQDVAVKDLVASPTVFVKNELSITGQIRVDGFVNRRIPVRVLFETSAGKMETVAQENVTATSDGQLLPVHFTYVPQKPGEYKVVLEAVEQPGELVTTNNRLSTFVNVRSGGLRALYVEGAMRVEQVFLRRALDASADINVDYLRVDPRDAKTRPGDMAARFRPGKYDVYILGDVDSAAFQESELKDLAATVSRGAGLIMLGGYHSFGPGGYTETPLAKVLPIYMDRFERQSLDDPEPRSDVQWPGPLKMTPTPLGLRHFALMLAGNRDENEALWAKLPPLDGANRFRGLAPGAVELAEAGRGKSLLAAHQYGDGRVMAFAGDTTWRWAMHGYETAHKRFWRQVILWLARKDQATEGNVWVKLDQRNFAPQQRVEFTAGAQSAAGEPVSDASFEARIVLPDGSRRPLSLVRQGDQVSGSLRDTQAPGDYAIEVTASHPKEALGTARARFVVVQQDLELDNAAADPTTLESLAAMTGGQSLAPEQLPELLDRLAHQTEQLDVQQETKKTFWDGWPFFFALVGLLSVEWYLRKRWGLV